MIAAFQSSAAGATARSGFGIPARPLGILVTANAIHSHLHLTFWMRQLTNFVFLWLNVPGAGWFEILVDNLHLNGIMTFGSAWVLAIGYIVSQQAWLSTRRALVHVTIVRIQMMAF